MTRQNAGDAPATSAKAEHTPTQTGNIVSIGVETQMSGCHCGSGIYRYRLNDYGDQFTEPTWSEWRHR